MEKAKCAVCGTEFVKNSSSQKYCSKKCYRKAKYIREKNNERVECKETQCPICGKTFMPRSTSQIYCSTECQAKARNIRRKKQRQETETKRVEEKKMNFALCPVCERVFRKKFGNQKFCSIECKQKSQKKEEKPDRDLQKKERELTVKDDCKHPDCKYRGMIGTSTPCCDYILKKRRVRGYDIDKCERWKE